MNQVKKLLPTFIRNLFLTGTLFNQGEKALFNPSTKTLFRAPSLYRGKIYMYTYMQCRFVCAYNIFFFLFVSKSCFGCEF